MIDQSQRIDHEPLSDNILSENHGSIMKENKDPKSAFVINNTEGSMMNMSIRWSEEIQL